MKTCAACGREYEPTGRRQLYCPDCRDGKYRERKARWYSSRCWLRAAEGPKTCAVCGEPAAAKYRGVLYCGRHYRRMRRYGCPERPPRNGYEEEDGVLRIALSGGGVCLADAEDRALLEPYTWRMNSGGYAVATQDGRDVSMTHVLIPESRYVMHRNGNPLDNRRVNLRLGRNRKEQKTNEEDSGTAHADSGGGRTEQQHLQRNAGERGPDDQQNADGDA